LVELVGLEPTTSSLRTMLRSNHLGSFFFEMPFSPPNQQRHTHRKDLGNVGKSAQRRALCTSFQLADIAFVVAGQFGKSLLRPPSMGAQEREFGPEGLVQMSGLALFVRTNRLCHTEIIMEIQPSFQRQ